LIDSYVLSRILIPQLPEFVNYINTLVSVLEIYPNQGPSVIERFAEICRKVIYYIFLLCFFF
jgi:hypothetical protein